MKNRSNRIGAATPAFSLIEVIVVIGVFIILISGITFLALGNFDPFFGKGNIREVERFAEEAREILQIIKERSWSEIATTTPDALNVVKDESGVWTLGYGTETRGSYIRDIRISSVYRDSAGEIATTTDDGTLWHDTDWPSRMKIVVDPSKVSGTTDLSDFPILISTSRPEWRSSDYGGGVAQSDGGDILFTASDGTTNLAHEVERYTPSSGSLVAWVEIPTLDYDNTTVVYMYYGNTAGGLSEENPAEVWSNGYVGVWHMAEDPSVSTDGDCGGESKEVCDSTSNSNDADSSSGMTTDDLTDGLIGRGIAMDGDDYLSVPQNASLDLTDDVTVSMWLNKADEEYAGLLAKTDGSSLWDYDLYSSGGQLFFYTDNDYWQAGSVTTYGQNEWYFVAFTMDGGIWDFYIDESNVREGSDGVAMVDTNQNLYIGTDGTPYNGIMDEVRLANVPRTDDWMLTQYNSQVSPETFYTAGSSTTLDPATKKVTVTISTTDSPGRADYVLEFFLNNWEAVQMSQTDWGGDSGVATWTQGQDDYGEANLMDVPTSSARLELSHDENY